MPLVLYHGEAPWNTPRAFHELLDLDDELRAMAGDALLDFRYLLDDLGRATDESLLARSLSPRAADLWALKYGRRGIDALERLRRWADAVRGLLQREGVAALVVHLRYTLLVNDDVTQRDLEQAIGALGPDATEAIMTVGQQLIEQGRVEGREEGREEGLRVALRALVRAKLGQVPPVIEARIVACSDSAALIAWIEAVGPALDGAAVLGVFAAGDAG